MNWIIYGANGYTGHLIAEEAVRRGLRPILAGRNAEALAELGEKLKLPVRVFDLGDRAAVSTGMKDVELVLHCAGPFSATCAPMLEACLEAGAHYLDITGEMDVFAHCHAQDARAKARGIVVMPGTGFDVVPTDCLAAQLKRELPTATSLVLGFEAAGGPSPGTAKTAVEGLGNGGRVRVDGELKRVPLAWKTRSFERDGEKRLAMTIPWGDVYTAYVSTGIPNIEVYMTVPPSTVGNLRRMRWLGPVLGFGPVQSWLKSRVTGRVRGPSDQKRSTSFSTIWGEVRDADGNEAKGRLQTPNGYELTVTASLGITQRLLTGEKPAGGYFTPSLLMGADYVMTLPGVSRH